MKKIIFLVNTDIFFISHRLSIAKQLLKTGFEVHIATEFTKYRNQLKKLGFKTHEINFYRNSLNFFKNIISIFQIFLLLRKIKPNIFHLISIKPIILGGIISFISPINSLVISITGLGSMFLHKGIFNKFREYIFINLYKIIFMYPKLIVILQNNYDKKYLINNSNLKKKKIKIIKGSGIDLKKFKFSKIKNKLPTILMASRIIGDKGVKEYVSAAKYLKKEKFKGKFLLIGNIDSANPSAISKYQINEWKKDKLIFYLTHKQEIKKYIKDSTIVVLPSYREGFPKILMEAAACGRPVIASDVPGCKDAVLKNITGFLVPVKNYVSLAKAIKKLSQNRNLLIKIGKAARKHAVENFDVKDVVSNHLCIYKTLIK